MDDYLDHSTATKRSLARLRNFRLLIPHAALKLSHCSLSPVTVIKFNLAPESLACRH